jgi:RNA polymerase sigma-70 factor, ECF subfamily
VGKHPDSAAVIHMRRPPRRAKQTGATGKDVAPSPSRDSALAARLKALVLAGERERAREQFSDLVAQHQRRAVRIAYSYLRDAHDADEAVQDAFVKVFTHIASYREEYPFEVWFTRILVNGCLDLRKARARRLRWAIPMFSPVESAPPDPPAVQPSPEDRVLSSERAGHIAAAIEKLPDRQRAVFTMCHVADQTTSEVSQALGLSEATVRVHLFRAVRKLRKLLASERHERPRTTVAEPEIPVAGQATGATRSAV